MITFSKYKNKKVLYWKAQKSGLSSSLIRVVNWFRSSIKKPTANISIQNRPFGLFSPSSGKYSDSMISSGSENHRQKDASKSLLGKKFIWLIVWILNDNGKWIHIFSSFSPPDELKSWESQLSFEFNYYLCTTKNGCSSVGRASVSKTECRAFESLLPCPGRLFLLKGRSFLFSVICVTA